MQYLFFGFWARQKQNEAPNLTRHKSNHNRNNRKIEKYRSFYPRKAKRVLKKNRPPKKILDGDDGEFSFFSFFLYLFRDIFLSFFSFGDDDEKNFLSYFSLVLSLFLS